MRPLRFGSVKRTGLRIMFARGVVALSIPGLWLFTHATLPALAQSSPGPSVRQPPPECLQAAKQVLGQGAEVVKYGEISHAGTEEAIAVVRLPQAPGHGGGMLVSGLVALQRQNSGWRPVLHAARQIQNDAGYIGIDFIDDSSPFYGYRVVFANKRTDGKDAFTIQIGYVNRSGSPEGVPLEVSWNPKAGRYQEFSDSEDPGGFKPEVKNPPHRTFHQK